MSARNNHTSRIMALLKAGDLDRAESLCRSLCRKNPGSADPWYLQGTIHGLRGLQEQAAHAFRKAVDIRPNHFESWAGLGNAYYALGKSRAAADAYEQASALQPSDPRILCNLGMALATLALHDQAAAAYRKAISLNPALPEAHLLLGNSMMSAGEFEAAVSSYRQATRLRPDMPDAIAAEVNALERLGDIRSAGERIRPFLAHAAGNVGLAVAYATISHHFGEENQALSILQQALANPALHALQRMELHFAAGKLLDRLQLYDDAFDHFTKANHLVPRHYDARLDSDYFRRVRSAFSRDRMRELPRSTIDSEVPVFIVGMPRSGTSLVERILASHPHIHGAGELRDMQQVSMQLCDWLDSGETYPECTADLTQQLVDEVSSAHLERLGRLSHDALRVVDKMPHNFLHLGLISLLFPKARVIHCVRDSMDTCLSCFFQYFAGSNDYSYDLTNLGNHYRLYQELMAHWESHLDIPIHTVRYEDIVERQEEISRELVEFCGLGWDPRCLEFHREGGKTRTASYDQVRRPLYRDSLERWRHYDRHLEPLRAALASS